MTTHLSDTNNAASVATDRELVAAARMLLQRMGVDPHDLMTDPADRPPVPTFDEYISQVEHAVSPGTAKTYGSYWKRILAKRGTRTLLEPTPTEIKQFTEEIQANAVSAATPAADAAPSRTSSPHCAASTGTPKTTN